MKKLLFTALSLVMALSACQQKTACDRLVLNGRIYTMDSSFSVVEAMAITNGKIVATGSSAEIRQQYRSTQLFDAQKKFIYPGLNDAHAHFVGYAEGLFKVNLVGTQSFQDVLQRTVDFANQKPLQFIEGRGWDQNDWAVQEFPNKKSLDSLFPETPVLLKRIDGHAALANQAALDFAGVSDTTTIDGGVVQLAGGELTGLLIDNAVGLVKFPEVPTDQKVEALLEAQQNLLAAGITSLTDAGLTKPDIMLIDSLQKAGILQLRINAMVADHAPSLEYFLKTGPIENDYLRVKSAKFYLDGALGSRGALLLQAYSDDSSNYGLQLMSRKHFENWAEKLAEKGWQMCVHAIGDSANRLAIQVMGAALKGQKNHRWRIEHAQIVHPDDIDKMAIADIIPSVQPTHATSDMYWARERLGERVNYAYTYRSLLEACGTLPLGTDFPVEDIDPMKTLRAAIYRQDANGVPPEGFLAEQALSSQQALRGVTHWPAYASFQENSKGRLIPGQLADFVVFDLDLSEASLADLDRAHALQTYIAGEVVFSR